MKKPLLTALILTLTIFTSAEACAQSRISCTLDVNDSVLSGRLFTVDMCVNTGSRSVSAFVLKIVYDTEFAEFRNAVSKKGDIELSDNDGVIKAVFANADGIATDTDEKLFSLRFKSLSQGDFNIEVECIECVDTDLKYINDVSAHGCRVVVTGKKVTAEKEQQSHTMQAATTNSIISSESVNAVTAYTLDGNSETIVWIMYGIVITMLVVLMIAAVVFAAQKIRKNQTAEPDDIMTLSDNDNE